MAYSSIVKPTDYFNTKLYTGNDTDDHAITGVNFQPDFVWIKSRSVANNHNLYDVIRGVNKPLKSNSTASEFTRTDALKSFDSDGFTLDDDATSDEVNNNGVTYASWNWLAGGTASSNSDGSITSTVSANTTAGFSIVSYTGTGSNATVGHGLGSAPKVVIVKTRDAARDWTVYHGGISNMASGYIILNATDAFSTAFSTNWNNTNPTSSVFSVGTANTSNNLNSNYIGYCFAEKKGFSKFGSYTGNGNADGAFVYTGFKPAWLMVKRTDDTQDWRIFDNIRSPFNLMTNQLKANTSDAEGTSADFFDFTSNGFKIRKSSDAINASGGTYIYMAFAENPFVGNDSGTAVPVVAR